MAHFCAYNTRWELLKLAEQTPPVNETNRFRVILGELVGPDFGESPECYPGTRKLTLSFRTRRSRPPPLATPKSSAPTPFILSIGSILSTHPVVIITRRSAYPVAESCARTTEPSGHTSCALASSYQSGIIFHRACAPVRNRAKAPRWRAC